VKIKAYIDQLTREKTQASDRATQLESALAVARGEAEALAAQCNDKDAQIAQLNHQVKDRGCIDICIIHIYTHTYTYELLVHRMVCIVLTSI
jgi:hypothetical protein